MARLPRANALLLGILRASAPPTGLVLGSRIPNTLPARYLMARRAGGSSVHPEALDLIVAHVQTWAPDDTTAEADAQWARDALYRASRTPQLIVPGVGYLSFFDESQAPVDISDDTGDHGVYRYSATYTLSARPVAS